MCMICSFLQVVQIVALAISNGNLRAKSEPNDGL